MYYDAIFQQVAIPIKQHKNGLMKLKILIIILLIIFRYCQPIKA